MDNHSVYQMRQLIIDLVYDFLKHHENRRDSAQPGSEEEAFHESVCDLLLTIIEHLTDYIPKWASELERALYRGDRD